MTDSDCKQGEDTKALTSTIRYPANLPQDPFPSNMYASSAHKNPPFKCYSLCQEGKQTPPHRPITHSSAGWLALGLPHLEGLLLSTDQFCPKPTPSKCPLCASPTRPLLTPGLQVGQTHFSLEAVAILRQDRKALLEEALSWETLDPGHIANSWPLLLSGLCHCC